MTAYEPCQVTGCRARPNHDRHLHPLLALNAIGETCWTCRISDWVIMFGGLLPVMVRCRRCSQGFNLSERLRLSTSPHERART